MNELITENEQDNEMLAFLEEQPITIDHMTFRAGMDFLLGYKETRMRYVCAMKEIRTKFEVLSTEFGVRYDRNPIAGISTRLKSTTGIIEKMHRRGLDVTLSNMEQYIQDIAGVRVICSYIDDIYLLADALKQQKDITLLCEKDYIQNPKPNGYRSLHLIVSVPVFFADKTMDMTVEVQIRTIAMDFWASLEHELKYKQSIQNSDEIAARLQTCAEVIAATDLEMQNLRKEIEENTVVSEEEKFLKRIKSIETPL